MTREELIKVITNECERTLSGNEEPWKLLDIYLKYNGIIGYTWDIIDVVEGAYNIKLEK